MVVKAIVKYNQIDILINCTGNYMIY